MDFSAGTVKRTLSPIATLSNSGRMRNLSRSIGCPHANNHTRRGPTLIGGSHERTPRENKLIDLLDRHAEVLLEFHRFVDEFRDRLEPLLREQLPGADRQDHLRVSGYLADVEGSFDFDRLFAVEDEFQAVARFGAVLRRCTESTARWSAHACRQ